MSQNKPKPVKATAKPLADETTKAPAADALAQKPEVDQTPETENETGPLRPEKVQERIPFGAHQPKLALPEREGYQRRWFHDTPGRIQRAMRGGWTKVTDENGQPITQIVGVAEQGGGLRSYAMEIPKHLYEQDMAAQQAIIDEFDDLMLRGAPDKAPGDDGRYVPEAGGRSRIDVRTSRRAS